MANRADPAFPVIWAGPPAPERAEPPSRLHPQPPADLAAAVLALALRYGGLREIVLLVRPKEGTAWSPLPIDPAYTGPAGPTLGALRAAVLRAWDQVASATATATATATQIAIGPGEPNLVFAFQQDPQGTWGLAVQAGSAPDDHTALERIASHLVAFLQAPAECPLARVAYLTSTERDLVARMNQTFRPLTGPACLHHRIELIVDEMPDRTAVIQGRSRLTYGQLDEMANALAHRIRALGIGVGGRVAIHATRGAELVIAAYATLKAGAAYVPIDPLLPSRRRETLYRLGKVDAILTGHTDGYRAGGSGAAAPLIVLGPPSGLPSAPRSGLPRADVGGHDLAYVIFTSGSSGEPKGVLLDHAGRTNMILDLSARIGLSPDDRLLAVSSPSFDLTVFDVFAPLMAGAAVVFPRRGQENDVQHWADLAEQEAVTVWQSVPSSLSLFLNAWGARQSQPLRAFLMGGDWIPLSQPDAVWRAFPGARFISLGGATEASVHSTFFEVTSVDPAWRSIPYGHPMTNQTAYVLDAFGTQAAVDQSGELFLGGMGIAAGYQDRAELTAEKFVPDPFRDEPRARLYRTGDQARLRGDGELELLGRVDQQVKIGGIRIELGEIQACLLKHPGVTGAIVLAVRNEAGMAQALAACVTVTPAASADGTGAFAEQVRTHLLERLPPTMVPGRIVVVDRLPVNQNGKIARAELERAVAVTKSGAPPVAETGAVRAVAETWREVLGLSRVPRAQESFLELGGSSLAAMQVVSRLNRRYGSDIKVSDLVHADTVGRVAQVVMRRRGGSSRPALGGPPPPPQT